MSPQATGAHVGTADPPRGGAGGDAYHHETEIAGNVAGYFCFVEMGGLEPPSKQTTTKLSTCLFCLWLSETGCRQTGYPNLIL